MTNEAIIRNLYNVAESKDIAAFNALFTDDATITDMSSTVVYEGDNLGGIVELYGDAFSDMHRELFHFYLSENVVCVQLALQGTHDGPLVMAQGTIEPTGQRMDAPCCDVFELVGGKVKRFDCYPSGTVVMTQLGVLGNLQAALTH